MATTIREDNYIDALDAAYRSLEDGSVSKIHTGRDSRGLKIIWALSDQGPNWFTWYSEADSEYIMEAGYEALHSNAV